MHAVLYMLFDKDKAKTSDKARDVAYDYFAENFCGDENPADWFVVGGRWSGELTKLSLPPRKLKKLEKEYEKKHGWYLGGKKRATEEQRREQIDKMFKRYFPDFDGKNPYWRNTYKDRGEEDDAVIVDEAMWNKLVKKSNYKDIYDGGACESIEGDDLTKAKNVVDKKWLVVIDFHF